MAYRHGKKGIQVGLNTRNTGGIQAYSTEHVVAYRWHTGIQSRL